MQRRRDGISDPSAAHYSKPGKGVGVSTIPIDGIAVNAEENNNDIGEEFTQFWGLAFLSGFSGLKSKRTVGKKPIFISILMASLDSPSCCGRSITYDTLGEQHPSITQTSLAQGAWATIKNIYKTLPQFRGPSDYLNPLQYANWLVGYAGVTAEIGAKFLGSVLSQVPYQLFKIAGDKEYNPVARFFAGVVGVLAVPTVWLAGQVFFTIGNLASYGRRFFDGVANFVSSGIALIGDKVNGTNNYGETYPRVGVSLRAMVKSAVLSIGVGIPLLSGFINRVFVMPTERWLAKRSLAARQARTAAYEVSSSRPKSSTANQMKAMKSNNKKTSVSLVSVTVAVPQSAQKLFDPKKIIADKQYYDPMLSRFKKPAIETMLAFYERNRPRFDACTTRSNLREKLTDPIAFLQQPVNAKAEHEFRKFLQANNLTEISAFTTSRHTSELMDKLKPLVEKFRQNPTQDGYEEFCREGREIVSIYKDIVSTGFPVLRDMILHPEKYNDKTAEERQTLIEGNYACLSQDKSKCAGFLDIVHLVSTLPASGELSRILRKPEHMQALQNSVDLNLYMKISQMNTNGLFNHPANIDELNRRLSGHPINVKLSADELNQIKEQAEYRSLLPKVIVDNIDRECHLEGAALRDKIAAINNFVAECKFQNTDIEKTELKNLLAAINVDSFNIDQIYSALRNQHQPVVLAAPVTVPAPTIVDASAAAPVQVVLNHQQHAEFKQLHGKHDVILHLIAREDKQASRVASSKDNYPRIRNLVVEATKKLEKLPETESVKQLKDRYKKLNSDVDAKLKNKHVQQQGKRKRVDEIEVPVLRTRANNGG